jgi:endo-1,4-beta-mannosidase
VLNRENTVTHRRYRDEPAVLGWELINEPDLYATGLAAWLSTMAQAVRAVDTNHLVGVAIADGDWLDPVSDRWDELDQPELDFFDGHHYPPPIGSYDPDSSGSAAMLTGRIEKATSLGKAYFIGEFGMENTAQDADMEAFYDLIAKTGFDAGAVGVLSYSWGPPGPNNWGGPLGGFCIYTDRTGPAGTLKSYADAL